MAPKVVHLPYLFPPHLYSRVRPRFFDQVGHETMYASSGNKHFFTKSCHCQTYQNYEQPPRTSQNSYLQIFVGSVHYFEDDKI